MCGQLERAVRVGPDAREHRASVERAALDPDTRAAHRRAFVRVDDAAPPPDLAARRRSHHLEPRFAGALGVALTIAGAGSGLLPFEATRPTRKNASTAMPGEEDGRLREQPGPADRNLHRRLAERLVPRRARHVAKPHERLVALRGERQRETRDAALDGCCADTASPMRASTPPSPTGPSAEATSTTSGMPSSGTCALSSPLLGGRHAQA